MLRPGFTLPPLMFSADEIEALVLVLVLELAPTETRYPRRRIGMIKEWREKQSMSTTAGN